MTKVKEGILFDMVFGEASIFYDTEREIYTLEWEGEKLPYHTNDRQTIVAMAFAAQWASKAFLKVMPDYLNLEIKK